MEHTANPASGSQQRLAKEYNVTLPAGATTRDAVRLIDEVLEPLSLPLIANGTIAPGMLCLFGNRRVRIMKHSSRAGKVVVRYVDQNDAPIPSGKGKSVWAARLKPLPASEGADLTPQAAAGPEVAPSNGTRSSLKSDASSDVTDRDALTFLRNLGGPAAIQAWSLLRGVEVSESPTGAELRSLLEAAKACLREKQHQA